jgi:hypothetical protein
MFLGLLVSSPSLAPQAAYDQTEPDTPPEEQRESPLAPETLPLKRLTLFSSGLGFFEHQGQVSGAVMISLPFKAEEMNDALKSLFIEDPASSPQVVYPSEQTLPRTLKGLRIDLSRYAGIPAILDSLKGTDIQVYAPLSIQGRILGVEYRVGETQGSVEDPYLALYTDQGIQAIPLKEVRNFAFSDPKINADLTQALDLIRDSRNRDTRNIQIQLPGEGSREVSLSYVIPASVWKASYRLDLSADTSLLQGWAIVDNVGDTDWKGLGLSLVSGRPVSFIQNLYAPYHLPRPVLPLSIPGIAPAQTYDSGWSGAGYAEEVPQSEVAQASPQALRKERVREAAQGPALNRNLARSTLETPSGEVRGEQFAFTLPQPVSLARQQSAMLPLVDTSVEARKTLIFSGAKALGGGAAHPALGLELTNTTGMPLPPGPVTVYDGGLYGGDGLFAFFPEQERQLIAYGDELGVTGYVSRRSSQSISTVTVHQGIMQMSRKLLHETHYTWKNASPMARELILEHPITGNTVLTEPASFDTRTDTLYRFALLLPAAQETAQTIQEEQVLVEEIALTDQSLPALIGYSQNDAIPEDVRSALQQGIQLKRAAEAAEQALGLLNTQRDRLIAEQDRIRRNLEAVGNQTPPGQEYLNRLLAQDAAIDQLQSRLEEAEQAAYDAKAAYDAYFEHIGS